MDKRITLVTGASRGIGRASALALSAAGHHVIAMARSKLALEKLDDEITAAGGSVTLIPMDLKDKAGFETVGNVLAGRYGRLDGLLGNAGVLGTLGPIQSVGPRSFEETIEVNLTANWRLIRAMAPLMQRSETPRAVFIPSGVVPRPRAFWGPYQASKAGLEGLIAAWADESDNTKFRVNLFDPGATRTGMRAEAMPGEDPDTLPTPEEVVTKLTPMLEAAETRNGQRIVWKD